MEDGDLFLYRGPSDWDPPYIGVVMRVDPGWVEVILAHKGRQLVQRYKIPSSGLRVFGSIEQFGIETGYDTSW